MRLLVESPPTVGRSQGCFTFIQISFGLVWFVRVSKSYRHASHGVIHSKDSRFLSHTCTALDAEYNKNIDRFVLEGIVSLVYDQIHIVFSLNSV